jgi:hypothetical protein
LRSTPAASPSHLLSDPDMSHISRSVVLLLLALVLSTQAAATDFCDTYGVDNATPNPDSPGQGGECKQFFNDGVGAGENNIPLPPRSRAFKVGDPKAVYFRVCGLQQWLNPDARTLSYVTLAEITYTTQDAARSNYAMLITATSSSVDTYELQADIYLTGSAELSITDPESPPAEPISSSIVLGTIDENCGLNSSSKQLMIDFSQEGSVVLNLGNSVAPENDIVVRPPGPLVPLQRKHIFAGPMIASNINQSTLLLLGWQGIYDGPQ